MSAVSRRSFRALGALVLAVTVGGATLVAVGCGGDGGGGSAASATDGGTTPEDLADAGTDGNPLAHCKGIPIEDDGTLDFDLHVVSVSGKITINGAAPDPGLPGRVTFVETKTKVSASIPIDDEGRFATKLAAGTYDVLHTPANVTTNDPASCHVGPSAWPCATHVLKSAVVFESDGLFEHDIETVTAKGKVSIGGAAFPASAASATLSFRREGETAIGAAGRVAIRGAGAAAAYEVTLAKGTYTVGYVPRAGACNDESPCNGGTLLAGRTLDASGALDVDVPLVVASGKVKVNGAALNASSDLGNLLFGAEAKSAPARTSATVSIGAGGEYSLGLLPGTYAVGYRAAEFVAPTSPLPRNTGLVLPSVKLEATGVLDVDLPAVKISGKLTIDGTSTPGVRPRRVGFASNGPLTGLEVTEPPAQPDVPTVTGGAPIADVGVDGTGRYETILLAGSYDVLYVGDIVNCGGVTAPSDPCNTAKVGTVTLAKGASGAYDVAVRTAKVKGARLVDGKPLTDAIYTKVVFTSLEDGPGGSKTRRPFSFDTPDDAYAVTLVAGTYDVGYAADDRAPDHLPQNSGTLRRDVALEGDGVLDLDARSAAVKGKLTVNGKAPGNADGAPRGSMTFLLIEGGPAIDVLETDGPLDYARRILHGRYITTYQPSQKACDEGSSVLPCVPVVTAGCDP